jgi:hypothetical protein
LHRNLIQPAQQAIFVEGISQGSKLAAGDAVATVSGELGGLNFCVLLVRRTFQSAITNEIC